MTTMQTTHDMTIRRADAGDALALGRLAQLDSTLYGGAPALVAELDDRIVAALPLDGSRAFADPFRRSAQAVAMLRLRSDQLDACQQTSRPRVSRALRAVRRRRRYRAHASA